MKRHFLPDEWEYEIQENRNSYGIYNSDGIMSTGQINGRFELTPEQLKRFNRK